MNDDPLHRPALLVIDIQRGAFDGVRCPPIEQADVLVERAAGLVGAAREGRVPIVFIQHCEGAGEVFEEGAPQWPLHERLAPLASDRVVLKRASSAFEGTDLDATLKSLGARTLVLCGLQSEFCVSNTAKSAIAGGYDVVIADDAHSTWPSNGEAAAAISERVNRDLQALGAACTSTDVLARSLGTARH